MKKLKYLLLLPMAALAFTACDTDVKHDIAQVDAPVLVSTTPTSGASNVKAGTVTIEVTYDKNVFFATEDTGLLSITNGSIESADVIGSSQVFTIVANCPNRNTSYTLTIPAGVVTGPNAMPAPEVSLTFSTVGITATPVNSNLIDAGKKVFDYLLEVYDSKTLSAMMCNVSWNTETSEQVYGWTGKYPAINGFDYIHLASSLAGADWIDYSDITPVKEWWDNGGLVTCTWHWNVPKSADIENPDPSTDYAYYLDETDFNAANATIEGTWENGVFTQDLASVARLLILLQDAGIPVLWRPFHEAAGGWFWWGRDAESFKAVWRAMFDYFQSAGVNNLIWVWVSETGDDDWYPGDGYVDIVGRDLYGDDTASCLSEYDSVTGSYGNKMAALTECGYSGTRISTISEQWNAGAHWLWFMPWYDNEGAEQMHADEAWWQDAMNQSFVVSREDLPAFN